MLICICRGVTENRLREEIRRGARSVAELQSCCRAGTDCGTCVRAIQELIERRDEHNVDRAAL
jgi:bacterioferritin-associated ferredoxin